jgi:hypothetical protein
LVSQLSTLSNTIGSTISGTIVSDIINGVVMYINSLFMVDSPALTNTAITLYSLLINAVVRSTADISQGSTTYTNINQIPFQPVNGLPNVVSLLKPYGGIVLVSHVDNVSQTPYDVAISLNGTGTYTVSTNATLIPSGTYFQVLLFPL